MTQQGDAGSGSGSSLLQARTAQHHHHHDHHVLPRDLDHDHDHQHLHLHQRRRLLHPHEAGSTSPHARSPPPPPPPAAAAALLNDKQPLHQRQVVIVQTVSVVNYIDASGTVTSVSTIRSPDPVPVPAAPKTLDIPAVVTAGLSALGNVLPSVSLTGLLPGLSDGAPSTTTSSSQSASTETLTSSLSSSSAAFPTLTTGIYNSSSTHLSSLFSNHTAVLYSNSTRTSSSSHSTFASVIATLSADSVSTATAAFDSPTAAVGGAGPGTDGGAAIPSATPIPSQPASPPPSGLAPETRNAVVGGVVGSVAGIALIAVVLLYLLKWKKQRGQGIMLLGDGDNTTMGRAFSPSGPASPTSGRGMVERSGPFAIPSALAKLSGGKRAIDAPPEPPSQERGFYRVSGRKLISVLESGGDGYSDPHDSVGSASSYYRDSQAFVESSNLPPLQLGSPMRPVSGVPIFRDGPQRTPVHEHGPVPPLNRPSAFPTATLPPPDALGRSFASRDGSRGSGSRFTEEDA